jgi:hypothetical protein
MISKMAIKKCSVCGKEFKCSPSGRKSTCSPDCYAKARQIKMESRYIGKRYGHLIINAVCRENGKTWAMCLCDCGNTQRIDVQALQHGQKACSRDCPYCKTGYKTPPADYVEGTNLKKILSKPIKSNKSGVPGVCWVESRKRWQVSIRFKGQRKTIGWYADKTDAIKARKAAEVKYFEPVLKKHGKL